MAHGGLDTYYRSPEVYSNAPGYTSCVRRFGLLDDLLDFCFPGSCAACQARCAGNCPLCDKCGLDLQKLAGAPACPLCALPLAEPGAPCPHCRGAGIAHYERILRLGVFK